MPTSPISKSSPAKKNLPIKWRDSAWSPRIVIRSLSRRRLEQGFWESADRFSDWNFGPDRLRFPGTPRSGRAGGRSPFSSGTLPFNRGFSGFTSRLDNLF